MKHYLVLLACLLATGTSCLVDTNLLAKHDKTNVVLVLIDDLGWNDVSYHNSEIQTPTIDRLAKEGVELNHFYVLCSLR